MNDRERTEMEWHSTTAVAEICFRRGEIGDALRFHHAALGFACDLCRKTVASPAHQMHLTTCYHLGCIHTHLEQLVDAEKWFLRGLYCEGTHSCGDPSSILFPATCGSPIGRKFIVSTISAAITAALSAPAPAP